MMEKDTARLIVFAVTLIAVLGIGSATYLSAQSSSSEWGVGDTVIVSLLNVVVQCVGVLGARRLMTPKGPQPEPDVTP